jgi:phosphoribosylformylglycinamidine cyclo-ligase
VADSRGESAYVVDVGPFYIASIVECLGSKALVADEMFVLTDRSYYAGIAQDTIAMAVNDLITVGQRRWSCRPTGPPAAACGSPMPSARARWSTGWKAACDVCKVAWGGGETPALAGHRRGGAHRPRRIVHRHRQPQAAAEPGRTSGHRAMPSCCWAAAASTPMA